MSSQWLAVITDARDANTVSSEISLSHQSASDIDGNNPDAWAYLRDLSSYFAAGSDGATSLRVKVVDGAVDATGTITLSSFAAGDTVTIGNQVFGSAAAVNHLLTASTYAVLAETAVTAASTGTGTALTGDLGSATAASIVGFPNGTYTGVEHQGDAAAIQAVADATTAYNYYAALPGYVDISAVDLGGHTLLPGRYSYSSSATWTAGALTLDAQGNPNAQFIIKTGTTLVTPSAASVILANGANAANVYWIVGSSATLGTTTSLKGNIIAQVTITLNTGASSVGRLLALTGAVTLDQSAVSVPVPPPPAPNPIVIGANDTITAANLAAAIDANPAFNNVLTATSVGPIVTVTMEIPGLVGNLIPLAISADGTVSGPFLSGGSQVGCGHVEEGVK